MNEMRFLQKNNPPSEGWIEREIENNYSTGNSSIATANISLIECIKCS